MLNLRRVRSLGTLDLIIMVIGVAAVIYHILYGRISIQDPGQNNINFLLWGITILFLSSWKKKPKYWPVWLILIIVSLITLVYTRINYQRLIEQVGNINQIDVIVGWVLVFLVLFGTYQAFGVAVPSVALVFILYTFICHYLPHPFYHYPILPKDIISWLAMGMRGMFGELMFYVGSYAFLFVIFGYIMIIVKADRFFIEVGRVVGQRVRGGTAQTAVVASGLVGTCTGGAVSDIILVGSFSIPAMKKTGYSPEEAGAIQAVSSSVAQIMPPVMGIAAFLMSALTNIPYIQICLYAIIPAILYVIATAFGTYFMTVNKGQQLTCREERPDIGIIIRRGPVFVIPMAVMIVFLASGYSPAIAAFWAIISSFVISFLRQETRTGFKGWMNGFKEMAVLGGQLALIAACLGMIYDIVTVSGLGMLLVGAVEQFSGGILIVALIITAIVSIILGCGAPTVAAYALVVIIAGPLLTRMGVDIVAIHLFAMYWAVFGNVTPPVAVASAVASTIAGAKFWPTSIIACRLALPIFIVAFLIIWSPGLIGNFSVSPLKGVLDIIAALCMVIGLQALNYSCLFKKLRLWETVVLGVIMAIIIWAIYGENLGIVILGIVCFIVFIIQNLFIARARLPQY